MIGVEFVEALGGALLGLFQILLFCNVPPPEPGAFDPSFCAPAATGNSTAIRPRTIAARMVGPLPLQINPA